MTPDIHHHPRDRAGYALSVRHAAPAEDFGITLLLDQEAMVVVGTTEPAPPESAEVRFGNDAGRRGAWRSLSWTSAGRTHFLGVLWAEDIVRAQAMHIALDAAGAAPNFELPDARRVELEAAPLFARLRALGADMAAVFDFLRRSLLAPPTGSASRRVRRFLLNFLDAISSHDGFVEILGRPESGGLMLQGWAVHLKSGALDLAILGTTFEIERTVAAAFERPDLLSTARGVLAYAKDASIDNLKAVQRVYFRAEDGYYHLDVIDGRVILEAPDCVAHLKDMLGRIEADPATSRALKRVCRVQFPGHETVSTLAQPVRLACDTALHVDGAGIFVTGWLLDPLGATAMVLLRSTAGFYARLEESWVRTPRRDVSEGFASDPLFAGRLHPDDAHHGFLAFVPRPEKLAPGEAHYLELVLDDDSCAFVPVSFGDADPEATLRRVLGGINIDEPAIDSIITAHIGPVATALAAGRPLPTPAKTRIAFGRAIERPDVAVIIPMPEPRPDFDVNLARLAGDPDFEHAELIVTTPRLHAEPVAALLRRCAPFYGLSGTLIMAEGPVDQFEALELGARAASAELILFLAPSVLPTGRGWLSGLIAALRQAPQPGLVSPTLLYEDDSVRYAGADEQPGPDPVAAATRFAGYSRHWLKRTALTRVWAGSIDCALMPRRLFLGAGGFSRELVGPALKAADFALRLGAQDARCYWAPHLALYALDDTEPPEPPAYWARVGELIDRWSFKRKWSPALAAAVETQ